MKYLIIIEPTANGFSAYSPDLDGCVAAGASREETVALMREAVDFHLEGLLASGWRDCWHPGSPFRRLSASRRTSR